MNTRRLSLLVIFVGFLLPRWLYADTNMQGVGTPTVSACGSGPSVSGSDALGIITVGSGVVTSCTLSFSKTYPWAPTCVLTPNSVLAIGVAPTTSEFVASVLSTIGGGKIYYRCSWNIN